MLVDLDVWGRPGSVEGALAVSNAILLYIGSANGDYLYDPTSAGEVSSKLFKLSSVTDIPALIRDMEVAVTEAFSAYVGDVDVGVELNGRDWDFSISWSDREGVDAHEIEFSEAADFEIDYGKEQVEVVYTGDNLLGFVLLQDVNEPAQELGLGWRWGRFDLVNLRESDPRFAEIMGVIT